MRPGDRRTKTMDRDPNTESKAQCLAELSRLSLPDKPPLYLTYVWVRASCAVAHRDYSSLHACKEEEEERCLFLQREW